MGVATLEDLQGTIEVVVFPKLYEQTVGTWTEGSILLVAGRIDHRGEEVSLLADLVTDWDGAVARGPEAFAREVAAGDRGRPPRRQRRCRSGPGDRATATATANGQRQRPRSDATGRGARSAPTPLRRPQRGRRRRGRPEIPYVSPLRAGGPHGAAPPRTAALPAVAPGRADPDLPGAAGPRAASHRDRDVEPALPDEARDRAAGAAARRHAARRRLARTRSSTSGSRAARARIGSSARWRRSRACSPSGPGSTRVVLHVPAQTGATSLPMELRRGVAYDAELLAEVRRRLGEGIVELSLG